MVNHRYLDRYLETHLDESIAELSRFCAQPSVAAQNWGIDGAAEMTAEMLRARGFQVQILPTEGSPIVYAERKGRNRNKTLLFYNHYDVQPPEPLNLWETPPFEPTIRDGKLYARGVSDDKGQLLARLFALDALLATEGELPCNVKFVIEGEEEIGSIHLEDAVREHADLFAADACLWEFGGVGQNDEPHQIMGMRGICYVELSVKTADVDTHSGLTGGIFPNAAWRLVWALNTLKSLDERILLPGFYDDVQPPTPRDLELLAALPDPSEEYKRSAGIKAFIKGIKDGLEMWKAALFDPTCTICGLQSGYQGKGSKTVLPSQAVAKVDFRLVPNQSPEAVLRQLKEHLAAHGFHDVHIKYLGGEHPIKMDPDDPFINLVVEAARPVYGMPQQKIPMSGGSGPGYIFHHYLGVPIATAGIAYPGSNIHAPNENIRLDLYLKGARHIARVVSAFARSPE